MSKRGRPNKNYEKREMHVSVRLSAKEYHRLRTLADEKEISMGSMIRLLINEYWAVS